MKDELSALFRDRFAGHEAPVDAGAWQAIEAKLSAGAVGSDALQELFQERFAEHESPVDPSVWANVSSQLGHGVAATGGGSFMGGLGWAAAGIGVLAVVGAAYLFNTYPTTPETIVEEPVLVSAPEGPKDQAEEAATVAVVPSPRTEAVSDPTAAGAGEETSRPIQAAGQEPSTRSTGPEPTVPAAPADVLPEPGSSTTAVMAEGPAIVEGIISQLTERVKADVESKVDTQIKPDDGPPSDEGAATEPELDMPPTPELPQLFLPNTFTPNGDGVNDTYRVSEEDFARMMIRVYSVQNNQLVFSTDSNEPWTGANCNEGYYLVAVEALAKDGRLVTQGKVVWLNRTPIH